MTTTPTPPPTTAGDQPTLPLEVLTLLDKAEQEFRSEPAHIQHGLIAQFLVGLAWTARVDANDQRAIYDAGRGYTDPPVAVRSDILATAQIFATLATATAP